MTEGNFIWLSIILCLLMLLLPHPIYLVGPSDRDLDNISQVQLIRIVSWWAIIWAERRTRYIPNIITPGTMSRNELYKHVDTYCDGNNWDSNEYNREIFEVIISLTPTILSNRYLLHDAAPYRILRKTDKNMNCLGDICYGWYII